MKFALHFTVYAFIALFFTSCEVDFSPNAEWKNIPVIYCLLDQEDDTTYVRVQRCFLPEGNIYDYGMIADSIYYPKNYITVSLLAYEGGVLKDSIPFEYTMRERDSGGFAYGQQPVYSAPTRGRLKENHSFVLSVRKASDGSLIASTKPISLIRQTTEKVITKPNVTVDYHGDTIGNFSFHDEWGGIRNYCQIKWNPLTGARLYQPVVRIYYQVAGETKYFDAVGSPVRSSSNELYYSQNDFVFAIKNHFQGDTTAKHYLNRIDLYLHCCSEELRSFLDNTAQASSFDFTGEYYSNVICGEGIFAARRTHLFKRMPSDDFLTPGHELYESFHELGFY